MTDHLKANSLGCSTYARNNYKESKNKSEKAILDKKGPSLEIMQSSLHY